MDDHNVFLKPPVWLPIVVAVLVGGCYIAGKNIESAPEPAMITVSGEGKVEATPDIALLSFGVQTGRQSSAEIAMTKLAEDMNAIIAAVKAAGVEEKDIQTQYLNLNPAYDWLDGRQVERGFEASQSLQVKVRDLDKISDILDVAVSNGANQSGGVSFTIDEITELQAQAREEAINDAEAKAQKLADQLGVTLGAIRGFSDGYMGGVPMPYYERAVSMDAGSAMNQAKAPEIPAGEQEINANVSITYEIY